MVSLLAVSALILHQNAYAQPIPGEKKKERYTLSGYVKEKGSGELLVGASVYVVNKETGTSTNTYGFYSITLPEDSVEVMISFVGYQPRMFKMYLRENTQLDVDITSSVDLETVDIVADRKEKLSESSRMSMIEIPVQQIREIPALLGEKDALKVIQLMPGVQSGSEGNSGLYVRGGGPDQNLIILDDATVYNAYHLFGFFSLFNGDALKSIELTKGGFPARYGGRLSSVVEMNMKEGNKDHITGEAGIGLISSKLTLEGPLQKGKSSFLLSGRRTYIDALTKPFQPPGEKFSYYFYDMNAKVNYDFGATNKVYLSGYFGRDQAKTTYDEGDEEFRLFWGNATGTARWNHLFNEKLFSNASFIVSNYNFSVTEESHYENSDYELRYSSGIRDFAVKYDLDFRPSPKHYIRTGLISTYHRFRPSAVVVKDEALDDFRNEINDINAVESGIYIEDDFRASSRLKFNIGLRASHFINEGKQYLRPEPRFSARYMLTENLSAKASFANMNQYVHLLTQTGIGLPTDLWVPATGNVPPQRSNQVAAGLARDLPQKDITISLEGYYKKSDDIIAYKEGASFLLLDDPESADEVSWEDNVTSGQAWSYGVELLLQKKIGRFSGWIGYTLSFTQLQFDSLNFGEKYWARYDRRHDASVVAIYKLKENKEEQKKMTISMTWVYGTGNAITLPVAQFKAGPNDPVGGNGERYYYSELNEYGERNSFRMAPYHRLDLSLQFHKRISWGDRTFELSFYNLYNRKNPFFYYADTKSNGERVLKQVSLFPLLPSISYTVKF